MISYLGKFRITNIFIYQKPFLAQFFDRATGQTETLLKKITLIEFLQGLFVILIFCGLFSIGRKTINWFSEQGGRKRRLTIKRILPFWRLFILFTIVIILIRVVFDFSPNYALTLTSVFIIVIGFAIKDYIGSLIAGIIGLFEYCYRVGDRIQIGEHYGEVIEYGLRSVRIRTPGDSMVIIPHSKLWTNAVSNANYGKLEMQVITKFYFAHNVDFGSIKHFLYQAAYTSKYTQLKQPIVVISEEKPWGICFTIKSYPMDARDEFVYKTDLIERANRIFLQRKLPRPIVDVDLLE